MRKCHDICKDITFHPCVYVTIRQLLSIRADTKLLVIADTVILSLTDEK